VILSARLFRERLNPNLPHKQSTKYGIIVLEMIYNNSYAAVIALTHRLELVCTTKDDSRLRKLFKIGDLVRDYNLSVGVIEFYMQRLLLFLSIFCGVPIADAFSVRIGNMCCLGRCHFSNAD
jgi:hypothetical protein